MNPDHISTIKLKIARNYASMRQEDVARELGLPRTAITQLEAGKRKVKGPELQKLADLYERPVEWFRFDSLEDSATAKRGNERPKVNDQSFTEAIRYLSGEDGLLQEGIDLLTARDEFLKRSLDSMFSDHGLRDGEREDVNRAVMWCYCAKALEHLLGAQSTRIPVRYDSSVPESTAAAIAQGEECAEMERQRLGIGHSPIADIQALVANQGIWATSLKFPSEIYSVFLRDSIVGEIILVNSDHKYVTQRMAMAQGYAHTLFDSFGFSHVSGKATRKMKSEQRANGFASAFLLPKQGVFEELAKLGKVQPAQEINKSLDVEGHLVMTSGTPRSLHSLRIGSHDIAHISNRYDVSSRLATNRIANLKYITESRRVCLLEQGRNERNGWDGYKRYYMRVLYGHEDGGRREGTGSFAQELLATIAHMALEAFRKEKISTTQLHNLSRSLCKPSSKSGQGLSEELKENPDALLALAKDL